MGNSHLTIGHDGCAITSFCNGYNDVTGKNITPDMVAAVAGNFDNLGDAQWDQICQWLGDVSYKGASQKEDDGMISQYLKNPKGFALLRVNKGAHFMLAYRFNLFKTDVICFDPWYGKQVGAKALYHDIDGVRLFLVK